MKSILLITIDCLRPDHVGVYGYERDTTPNIDRIAKSGTKFERAYSNGPGTRWAFRAINMGVHPLRINGAGLPSKEGTTTAEALSERGYQTAAFADNPFLTAHFNQDRGFDTFRGTDYWANSQSSSGQALDRINDISETISRKISDGVIYRILKRGYDTFIQSVEQSTGQTTSSDPQVIQEATEWISDAEDEDNPYFAWVHLMDAHHPHQYRPEHREALGITKDSEHVRIPPNVVEAGEEPRQDVIDTYDANLREADASVGRLVQATGENTTYIITGDHGEEFGRHRGFHQASTYESMARVPLIIQRPNSDAASIKPSVNHIDIPQTLVSNISGKDAPNSWDGINLFQNDLPRRDIYTGIEKPGIVEGAVVRDNWKYHCRMSGFDAVEKKMLYNLDTDSTEENNVIDTNPETARELDDSWQRHLDYVKSSRMKSEYEIYDPDSDESARDRIDERASPSEDIEDRLEHLGYK